MAHLQTALAEELAVRRGERLAALDGLLYLTHAVKVFRLLLLFVDLGGNLPQ
jgi:hypothetical protein